MPRILCYCFNAVAKKDVRMRTDAGEESKSATLRSTTSNYKTPPESPDLIASADNDPYQQQSHLEQEMGLLEMGSVQHRGGTGQEEEMSGNRVQLADEMSRPPVPPPRTKRGLATKAAKAKLQDLHIQAESLELAANELLHIGESLSTTNPSVSSTSGTAAAAGGGLVKENELKGYLHMQVVTAKGLRQVMKTRWFVYDRRSGKLKYFRSERDEVANELPLGQVDLSTATFCYDVETDVNGEFTI